MPEPAKAEPLIVVTLLGISIVVKLVAPWKALCPILVKPLGSLTLLKLVQPWNRLFGKLVTWVDDKSMVVREVVAVLVVVLPLVVTPPNTPVPKLVKLFGTFTAVKLEQPWKAWLLILLTLLEANVTLVSEVIPSKAPWLVPVVAVFPVVGVVSTYLVIALTLARITMLAKRI